MLVRSSFVPTSADGVTQPAQESTTQYLLAADRTLQVTEGINTAVESMNTAVEGHYTFPSPTEIQAGTARDSTYTLVISAGRGDLQSLYREITTDGTTSVRYRVRVHAVPSKLGDLSVPAGTFRDLVSVRGVWSAQALNLRLGSAAATAIDRFVRTAYGQSTVFVYARGVGLVQQRSYSTANLAKPCTG